VSVPATITAIEPRWAVPGGRVTIRGRGFPVTIDGPPEVTLRPVGEPADSPATPARIVSASPESVRIAIPEGVSGVVAVSVAGETNPQATLEIGRVLTTGVHQVDNPAFDAVGRLWVTQSGGRDTKVSVPLYRVARNGVREPLALEIGNPTSLALAPDGAMFVTSRFDGQVYRVGPDDRAELYASELGVATGVACAADGTVFVGDRTGTIFKVNAERQVSTLATLPASVAAFHLAAGADGFLYVTAPTLATRDSVFRVSSAGVIETVSDGFGRPQGLAFDANGHLLVVDALAGSAGLYRLDVAQVPATPEYVLAAPALIGVAIDPLGGLVVASGDTVWRLETPPASL
jgi:sugar lactone lactonase YvrE